MGQRPLDGIKVVEVSMWAYVPSCGAILADWGAAVTKVEPPTGDPMRGLSYAGIPPGHNGFTFMYEIFNRGKRNVAMDLTADGAAELLYKMVADADVFLISLLPQARRKLKIDVDHIRAINPEIIYAIGSGQGAFGEDQEKGGYDAISFWARSGIASAITPTEVPYPLAMPGGAFGDGISGAMFAGGISAAIAQKARTGKGCVVDSSLLNSAMWAMQPAIIGCTMTGAQEMPKVGRNAMPNPLVNTYRTSDGRYLALCMLQGQRYWPGFCTAMGCPELIDHPDYDSDAKRKDNIDTCIAAVDEVFARYTFAEACDRLSKQPGQWDVVKKAGELPADTSAVANGYVQDVDYGDGRSMKMVSAPVQFDRKPSPISPAPELGAHTDEVMAEIGLDDEAIISARVAGILL